MMQTLRYGVVVGVDFGETGDVALTEALRFAAYRYGAELHVVHVPNRAELDAAPGRSSIERYDRTIEPTADRLWALIDYAGQQWTERLRETVMSVHVRFGDPAQALHQVAVDYDADLIVVGTRRLHGLDKLLLGSVAETLIRTAHVPVFIARPKDLSGLARTERVEPRRSTEETPPERREVHVYRPSASWTRVPFGTSAPY